MDSLESFKDLYKDQRAFVACNGLGLNDIDMSKLEGEVVIALNKGYMKEDMPITFLVTADKRIEKNFGKEIAAVPTIATFSNNVEGVTNYKLGWNTFSKDVTRGIRLGHSVTVVALQIVYHMGFNPVYIIGMDHHIKYDNVEKHTNMEYSNRGKDTNHFTEDYYEPGVKFRYQNLGAVAKSYLEARKVFEADGRVLLNASTQTKLSADIIPRIKFDEIF